MKRRIEQFQSWPQWAKVTSVVVAAFVLLAVLGSFAEEPVDGAAGGGASSTNALADAASWSTSASSTSASSLPTGRPSTTEVHPNAASSTSPTNQMPSGAPASGSFIDLVEQLVVADEYAGIPYDRSRFDHWIDMSRNGCNTRCEVLALQRRSDLPGLGSGGWLSIYDGYSTDDPTELEIDHVVALSEAWRSGAWAWDDQTRRAFANDLDSPALIAVTAAMNRAKSDRDPASWQPPNRDAWCDYVNAWVAVKLRWNLTAQPAEVRALRNMGAGCPASVPIVPAPVVIAPITAPIPLPTSPPPALPLVPATTAPAAPTTAPPPPPAPGPCDPSYPDVCIPSYPPDLNCGDIPHRRFRVTGSDPHRFDGDKDGIGCESG